MPRFGSFEFDAEQRELRRDGQAVHLTPKAFDLLGILLGAAPRVVSKDELHRRMWAASCVSDAALVGLIKEVRRALDDRDRDSPMIRTVHQSATRFAVRRPSVRRGYRYRSGSSWVVSALLCTRVSIRSGATLRRRCGSTLRACRAAMRRSCATVSGSPCKISAARTEPRSVGRWSPLCASFATVTSSHSGASMRCFVPRSQLCRRPL